VQSAYGKEIAPIRPSIDSGRVVELSKQRAEQMTASRLLAILAGAAAGIAAVPAHATAQATRFVEQLASGAIAIPEPGDFALFLLGVTGLIIGRRASRNRAARNESNLDG
jgi:hypothetical protein